MARTENYWKKTKLIEEKSFGTDRDYSQTYGVKKIDAEKEKRFMNGINFTEQKCGNG